MPVAVISQQLEAEYPDPQINPPIIANPISNRPENMPTQALGSVRPGPLLRLDSLQKASRWILKAGGLTFLTSNLHGFLYFFVVFFQADWAVQVLLGFLTKQFCIGCEMSPFSKIAVRSLPVKSKLWVICTVRK
jgi:hypothetical protein